MSSKKLTLSGTLMKADSKTKSGNIYPREVIEREVAKYNNLIKERRAIGQAFTYGQRNLMNASHLITDMSVDDDGDVYVKIEVLDTNRGQELRRAIESGHISFGLSGVGSSDVHGYVREDYVMQSVDWSEEEQDESQKIEVDDD